jgi:hypothetical protein
MITLAVATAPRVAWFATHQVELTPDTFGYLNVAREWRGLAQPPEWDAKAHLPADNQAARTPGYPVLLNAIFALSGHSASPADVVDGMSRRGAGRRHLAHLGTDENVRAVHAVQVVLGIAAAGIAFALVFAWTRRVAVSCVAALIAVGLNPQWIVVFEPAVLTEITSAWLLLATMGMVSRDRATTSQDLIISMTCGAAVLVRPPMIFAVAPILVFLVWMRRGTVKRRAAILVPALGLVASLVVFNGLRYGYWGVTSAAGAFILTHARAYPETLREPIRETAVRFKNSLFIGQSTLTALNEQRVPYLESAKLVQAAALHFIVDHPMLYLRSVVPAGIEFWSPNVRMLPAELNVVRAHSLFLWYAIVALESVLTMMSLGVFVVPAPPTARLAASIFIVSSIGVAFTAGGEIRRYAMPVEPLRLMCGVLVVYLLVTRHRPSIVNAVRSGAV